MKKKYNLLYAFILVIVISGTMQAQLENLTYEVRAQNFVKYDTITMTDPLITGIYNIVQFDLYIQQTNNPQNDAEKMRYAFGQYYWNLNIGSGLTVSDTAGGYATVTYVPGSTTMSNLNALPTNPRFVGMNFASDIADPQGYPVGAQRSSIHMSTNPALGSFSNVQISSTFPGTKIGTYRFKKKTGYFPVKFNHMRWRRALPDPFTKVFAYNGLGGASSDVSNKGTFIMDTIRAVYLKLTVIPEGYYNYLSNRLYRKDYVSVKLRSSVSPYAVVDSVSARIDSINFTALYHIPNTPAGYYYIVARHKNCIETWSSSPVYFITDTTAYNFTTSLNKAYGDNQKQIDASPVRFGMFSGNINEDAIVDAGDVSAIENDAYLGTTGDVITDLTGDYFVDAEDLSLVENNVSLGAIIISP